MAEVLLSVRDLEVRFRTYAGEVQAVRGVSFDVNKGEVVALVGESGCGKTVTVLSIMRLIQIPPGNIARGSIIFGGRDLLELSESEMQHVRGNRIAMVFQDPMTSLNPVFSVGNQLCEPLILHQHLAGGAAMKRAVQMLEMVNIPNARERLGQYPFQFSGGMRQRAMIAMALSCNPELLIADEPSTALDVTIQAQIIDLLTELKRKMDTAIMLITHDLGVVARIAQKVMVMYAGKIIERGTVRDIYRQPRHPYTWGLLAAVPRLDTREKKRLVPIYGQPPDLIDPPKGCAFWQRCNYAMKICTEMEPESVTVSDGHEVCCWLEHSMAPKVEWGRAVGQ
ncbi:MAG: ABC transporter ATP-binding protein [Firmicutes bacterium]|jgi:oligopeptide transport system ATP-binding protein|nr:ABC transporter ATP-binding protein [Bacillota bacterium]